MTLILAHNRLMLCDSFSGDGHVNYGLTPGLRKIVRCPDGSLIGFAGLSSNCSQLRVWAKAGMDRGNPPQLRREDDDCGAYSWLRMAPDGKLFAGCLDMIEERVTNPYYVGNFAAAYMFLGIVDHCGPHRIGPLLEVMQTISRRVQNIAPPFHLFDLDHPELDP